MNKNAEGRAATSADVAAVAGSNRLRRVDSERVLTLIDHLYGAALEDEDGWHSALSEFHRFLGARGLLLMVTNPTTHEVQRCDVVGIGKDLLEAYRQDWFAQDLRLPLTDAQPLGVPVSEQLLPKGEWTRSPILNEFLRPVDVPHMLAAALAKGPDRLAFVSLQRSRRQGTFAETDTELFRILVPHLARALELRDRLDRRTNFDALLERLPFDMLQLDAAGHVLATSQHAEELLRATPGLGLTSDGRLSTADPAARRALPALLRQASGVVHVDSEGGRLTLLAMPGTSPTPWIGPSESSVILVIFNPSKAAVSTETLRKTYGLTVAEARLTALLVTGVSLVQAADEIGISVNTAKTQLLSVYAKANCHNKGKLIHLILSGPALLH